MIIVLMGVSGSGKSTIGQKLATELDWDYYEGDDYHPQENIAKMAAGVPLSDDDREPWLSKLVSLISELLAQQQNAVLSCSALKQSYRDRLLVDTQHMRIVHLTGSHDLIRQRLKHRLGHYMQAGLLNSQFEDLEIPQGAMKIDIHQHPDEIVKQIIEQLD